MDQIQLIPDGSVNTISQIEVEFPNSLESFEGLMSLLSLIIDKNWKFAKSQKNLEYVKTLIRNFFQHNLDASKAEDEYSTILNQALSSINKRSLTLNLKPFFHESLLNGLNYYVEEAVFKNVLPPQAGDRYKKKKALLMYDVEVFRGFFAQDKVIVRNPAILFTRFRLEGLKDQNFDSYTYDVSTPAQVHSLCIKISEKWLGANIYKS